MINQIFSGVFDTGAQAVEVGEFLGCLGVSLLIGAILALSYAYKAKHTQSFLTTLAIMPAVVCVVIMMVNGNVGAGVAVAGAFSLIRFRSVPGTAREIGAIFIAMGAGLMTGMGYLGLALLFTVILCLTTLLYHRIGARIKGSGAEKILQITIPENLDYSGVFDECFQSFTDKAELKNVKTTNMGSLFKLTYEICMKEQASEKKFIDELRCRNGNLEIQISTQETGAPEL